MVYFLSKRGPYNRSFGIYFIFRSTYTNVCTTEKDPWVLYYKKQPTINFLYLPWNNEIHDKQSFFSIRKPVVTTEAAFAVKNKLVKKPQYWFLSRSQSQ